jgi:Kef-type K+ transport system membrane component KefB
VKTLNKSWREVLTNGLMVAFFFGTVGVALKFVTFFNHWVYFPSFPNFLDSAFLILSSTYFVVYIVYNRRRLEKETRKTIEL